jgi:hypothetical protein
MFAERNQGKIVVNNSYYWSNETGLTLSLDFVINKNRLIVLYDGWTCIEIWYAWIDWNTLDGEEKWVESICTFPLRVDV